MHMRIYTIKTIAYVCITNIMYINILYLGSLVVAAQIQEKSTRWIRKL